MAQGPSAADITQALSGMQYPAEKEGIRNQAQSNKASEEVLNALDQLPKGTYNSITEVTEAYSQINK